MKHQRVIEQPQRSTSNCCSKFNNYVIVHNLLLNTCTTMTPMSRDLLLSHLRYYDNHIRPQVLIRRIMLQAHDKCVVSV